MNLVYQKALEYKRLGFSVIPLKLRDKAPAVPWAEFQQRHASDEELKKWFLEGDYGIGVVTGPISGIVVVDLDGLEGINEAKKRGLASSVCSATGNGRHLYFAYPRHGKVVSNSVRLFPGIDVRGNGGFVVVPPSVHSTGKQYTWLLPPRAGQLPPLPEAFLETESGNVSEPNSPGWIGEALAGLKEGNRNDTFARVAGRLHKDGWNAADIKVLLTTHAKEVDFSESELDNVVASITSYPRLATPRGRLKTTADILATPSVTWLVAGAVPQRTTVLLGGMPGVGKSWLLLDTALELTRPAPLTVFGPGRTGKRILYIDEENGESLLKDRMNLLLRNKPDFDGDMINFSVDERLSLTDQAGHTRFLSMIRDAKPDVIFMDSLIQFHSMNENDAVVMSDVMNKLRAIRDSFNLTVFALHHEGKSVYAKEKENEEPTSGDLRGSNAIAASVETIFTLRKREGLMSLHHTKARFAQATTPKILELRDENSGLRILNQGETNVVPKA